MSTKFTRLWSSFTRKKDQELIKFTQQYQVPFQQGGNSEVALQASDTHQ